MRYTIDKILAEAKQKPKLPMSEEDLETFVSSLEEKERKLFVSKLAYLDDNYPSESIQDVVQESVYVCGFIDDGVTPVVEKELWSVEEPKQFITLPKGFEAFMEHDLYLDWRQNDLNEPTLRHNEAGDKFDIETSLQELQDWATATSYSPHLFSTTDPNTFYYATSASLYVVRDSAGKVSELRGTITGLYLRK